MSVEVTEQSRDGQVSTEELQRTVHALVARVDQLEAELVELRHQLTGAGVDLTPEVVLVISAAVAAYLGKRATVRQIHFAGRTAWAQQGRAAVQSSHPNRSW